METDSALSLYETCKVRTIKAGTLERLVEYMVSAFRGKDSTYVTIFLCTYRSFATTRQVLDLLLNRYQVVLMCGMFTAVLLVTRINLCIYF